MCRWHHVLDCTNFHSSGQIFADLTRGSILEREVARSQRAWCAKKPWLTLQAVTNEDGRSMTGSDGSGVRLFSHRAKMLEAVADGDQDLFCETILNYVQRAPNFIHWKLDTEDFDGMISANEESVVLMVSPGASTDVLEGLVLPFLLDAYKQVVEAACRTVCTPKSSTVGSIVRSPDAPRPIATMQL